MTLPPLTGQIVAGVVAVVALLLLAAGLGIAAASADTLAYPLTVPR